MHSVPERHSLSLAAAACAGADMEGAGFGSTDPLLKGEISLRA